MDLLCFCSVLCLLCLCECLFIWLCFVVTCWERADLLALVCGVCCEFVTFPLVSWVRCGTWLYRFLIFAPLLTLIYQAPLAQSVDYRSRGREFDPGPIPYFRRDRSWNYFYGNSHPSTHSRRVVVSYNWKYVHEVRFNHLHWHVVRIAQEKIRLGKLTVSTWP